MFVLPRPISLYPTLIKNIIPSPIIDNSILFDEITNVEYDLHGRDKIVMDRCIYNKIIYGCEYSAGTEKIIHDTYVEMLSLFENIQY